MRSVAETTVGSLLYRRSPPRKAGIDQPDGKIFSRIWSAARVPGRNRKPLDDAADDGKKEASIRQIAVIKSPTEVIERRRGWIVAESACRIGEPLAWEVGFVRIHGSRHA